MRNERKAMKNIMIIGAAVGDVLVYPASPEVFAAGSWPAREILLSTGGDGLNEARSGKKSLPVYFTWKGQGGRNGEGSL